MISTARINRTELAPVLIDEIEKSMHLKDRDMILYTVALNYLSIFGLWPFSFSGLVGIYSYFYSHFWIELETPHCIFGVQDTTNRECSQS